MLPAHVASRSRAVLRTTLDWLTGPFEAAYRHRQLLIRTALVNLRGMYAGSVFGLFWVALGPVLLLSLYATIYVVVFDIRPMSMTKTQYILYIFSGLVPYIGFSGALMTGSTSLSADRQVLLNTVFPAELVPLRAVLISSASFAVGLVILIVVDFVLDQPSAWVLLLPVIVLLQTMFVCGLVWVLSLATLILRDIQQVLAYAMIALLVATPIAYTPDMIPPALRLLIWLNPLAYYVISYQHILVLNSLPPTGILTAATVAGIASFLLGYMAFQRAKQFFFDYA